MKKGKLLVLGLIALMLAGGLALASCDDGVKCTEGCGETAKWCNMYCVGADSTYTVPCVNACK
jgi:hypothetical protein